MAGMAARSGLAAVLALAASTQLMAQALPSTAPIDAWGPDGSVRAVARHGDTLYVGGRFSHVGPATGPLAAANTTTGALVGSAWPLTGLLDQVVALPDGGWIASGFAVGDSGLHKLVRIGLDGRYDPSWAVTVDNTVLSLATDGATLYLGGNFTLVNGTARDAVAAVDVATAALLPWAPDLTYLSVPPSVSDLLAHQGVVYIAGLFSSAAGQPAAHFAAFDATTGARLPVSAPGLVNVTAMAAYGDRVHLVGLAPGVNRDGGVVLTPSTGATEPWPLPAAINTVAELAATADRVFVTTRIFVPGHGGLLYVLDPNSGASLRTPRPMDASVMALDATSLFIAEGNPGLPATYTLLALDPVTLVAGPWQVRLSGLPKALALRGGRIAAVGEFASGGGAARFGVFALSVASGRPTPFAPVIEGEVSALVVVGDVVVVGGSFTRVNGVDQPALAALDATTGALLPWRPMTAGVVHALAMDGSRLYVGGAFQVVQGLSRPNLASFDLGTASVTSWVPAPDAPVFALATAAGALLVGGDFATLAGRARGRGAVFERATSALIPWDPDASGRISSFAFAGRRVAVAGIFNTLRGQPSPALGVFDETGTLVPTSTACDLSGSAAVTGWGHHFFVGSSGAELCGPGSRIIATTPAGAPVWTVGLGPPLRPVFADVLARYADLLVAGGRFSVAGAAPALNLALFPVPSAGPPTNLQARVSGQTVSLSWSPPSGVVTTAHVLDVGTTLGTTDLGRFPVGTGLVAAVPPGTYYTRVRAVVNGALGEPSSEMIVTVPSTLTAPEAPAGLTASVAASVARLSWSAAAGNAESYVIEAGTSPGSSNVGVLDTGVVDTRIQAAVPAGTYYLRVRAKNAFGSSAVSNEVVLVVP